MKSNKIHISNGLTPNQEAHLRRMLPVAVSALAKPVLDQLVDELCHAVGHASTQIKLSPPSRGRRQETWLDVLTRDVRGALGKAGLPAGYSSEREMLASQVVRVCAAMSGRPVAGSGYAVAGSGTSEFRGQR